MKTSHFLISAIGAFLLPFFAFAQAPAQLVDVVATGHGETVREATKAALRAAVEQVVGTMVDATTLVENDELIEDEILSYSAGMIEKATTIGEPKKSEGGFYTVKVKATVKKGKLEEKLRAASAVNVTLDGADLFARMTAAQDNLADAEAMIKDVLAKHIACVIAEAVPGENGTSPLDLDPKTGEVFANVRVRIDMAKYTQFAKEVVDKLGPMAEKTTKISSEDYKANGDFNFSIPNPSSFENSLIIMGSYRTGSAIVLSFDKNRMMAIGKAMATGSIAFESSLMDQTGMELATKTHPVDSRYTGSGAMCELSMFGSFGDVSGVIVPMFGGNCSRYGYQKIHSSTRSFIEKTFRISLGTFTAEELKNAGKLEIKVGHMKDGQFTE